MATENNIIRLAEIPRRNDAAVAARARMTATENDAEYEEARVALVSAKPTSLAGIQAQLELMGALLEPLQDGDELTSSGRDELLSLFSAVTSSLARLTTRAA